MPEWRYELGDLEEEEAAEETLQPQSPSLENTVFLLVGVLLGLLAIGSLLI